MSMNTGGYSGGGVQPSAAQVYPSTVVPDHRDAAVPPTAAADRRVAAITGIVLGVIPMLSIVGLIVSLITFFGCRREGQSTVLAAIGIVVSSIVLVGTVFAMASGILLWIASPTVE